MIIEQLQMFIEAANKNNLTHAAPLFNTTRDRVRNHIIHLEKEVGFPLFVKTPNGSYLNKDGEIMYHAFQKMIMEYENAISTIKDNHSPDNKKYKIAITPKLYNSYYHVEMNNGEVLDNIFFDYVCINYDEFYNAVIRENVDFALMYNSNDLYKNKSLEYLPIYKDKLCLMISEKLAQIKLNELTINDISGLVIYYEEQLESPRIKQAIKKLKNNNTLIPIAGDDYEHSYNRINEEGACFLWHYKNAERKYQSGLTPIPISNTDETYCIVFKATEEKRQVAEKIIGRYRNNQIED